MTRVMTKEQGDDNGEGVEGGTVPVGSFYGGKGVKSKVPSTPSGKHTDVNKKDGKSEVPSTPSGKHTNVNKKDGKSKVPSTPSIEDTDVDKTTRPKSKNTPTPQPSEGATNIGAKALTFAPFQKKVDTMERRMTDTISVSMQSVQGSLTSVNTKSDALNARIGGIEDSLQGITNKIRAMKLEIHDDIDALSRDVNKLRLTVDSSNVTTKEVAGLKTLKFSLGIESEVKTLVSKETQYERLSARQK